MSAELILDARNATGESPVWHAAEQALYWVDIPAGRLHRWQLAGGQTQSWQADARARPDRIHRRAPGV